MNIKELKTKGKISEDLQDFLQENPKSEISMYDSAYKYASMADISDWGGSPNSVGYSTLADIVGLEIFHDSYIELDGKKYVYVNWGESEVSLVEEWILFNDVIYVAYDDEGDPIQPMPLETEEEAEELIAS